jgi:3-phenylpropionate/trans-cinnamate dioxygenase ferredoxin component
VAGHRIAVVRIDDEVYALGDKCSHQDVSLAEGEVDEFEKTLECWKHGSAFDLASGEALTLPATQPVPTYEARIEGDEIVVVIE